jgi:hypothetical protein
MVPYVKDPYLSIGLVLERACINAPAVLQDTRDSTRSTKSPLPNLFHHTFSPVASKKSSCMLLEVVRELLVQFSLVGSVLDKRGN